MNDKTRDQILLACLADGGKPDILLTAEDDKIDEFVSEAAALMSEWRVAADDFTGAALWRQVADESSHNAEHSQPNTDR